MSRWCVALGPGVDLDRIGGKARSLLALAAAGLPVPPALAITTDLFAAMRQPGPPLPDDLRQVNALEAIASVRAAMLRAPWPADFTGALASGLEPLSAAGTRLPVRFSVRSSTSIEDQASSLAPGLFQSHTAVSIDAVPEAVRAVLVSALAPGVLAYLGARGTPASRLAVAVVIHPFIDGEASGSAAFDPASPPPVLDPRGQIDPPVHERLLKTIERLAHVHGPVEIEWVVRDGSAVFLQMRPYRRRAARASDPVGEALLADGWRWDAAHNPLPLSPAQAGLVAVVDARCALGFRQRVAGGYLFYRPDGDAAAAESDAPPGAGGSALRELEALARRRLADPVAIGGPLERALDDFVAIYEPLFARVQPAARADLAAFRTMCARLGVNGDAAGALLADVPSAATRRAELARSAAAVATGSDGGAALEAYLTEFGDESPAWDVAAPTWREAPDALALRLGAVRTGVPSERVGRRMTAATVLSGLAPEGRAELEILLGAARSAVAAGEDDDALYARAQAHVRRALLREGARLRAAGVLDLAADVFWLPLETVRRDARGDQPLSRDEAADLIGRARTHDAEARARPPRVDVRGHDIDAGTAVRGQSGSGGACRGHVRIWNGTVPDGPHTDDVVLVAATLLPTELPLLDAVALVVETGGPLGHVAAQARERGIPALVGAVGATTALADGDAVLVDGDAGLVIKLR
jgi:phosphohistidine swiveling domain-containing protein